MCVDKTKDFNVHRISNLQVSPEQKKKHDEAMWQLFLNKEERWVGLISLIYRSTIAQEHQKK